MHENHEDDLPKCGTKCGTSFWYILTLRCHHMFGPHSRHVPNPKWWLKERAVGSYQLLPLYCAFVHHIIANLRYAKNENSLLVNVDIPIDTKRLVRISLYPSKIDLEIDTKQQWRANMINIYQHISKWQFKWTIICGLLICTWMPTRFWKCAVSACCDPTIRLVGCSPMISMIPSGHQPWHWNNHFFN